MTAMMTRMIWELVGSPPNVKTLFGSLGLQGMGDFLTEMVSMMDQTNPNPNVENGEESFEKLQELFREMLNDDMEGFRPSSHANYVSSSSSSSYSECSSSSDNRNLSGMNNTNSFVAHVQGFSMGSGGKCRGGGRGEGSKSRNWRRKR